MLLSEIPLEFILLKPYWLTGADGTKGTVTKVEFQRAGIYNDPILTVSWNNKGLVYESFVKFPDQCNHITVDMSMYPKMCKPFCISQLNLLIKHTEFWKAVVDMKEEIPANGI